MKGKGTVKIDISDLDKYIIPIAIINAVV